MSVLLRIFISKAFTKFNALYIQIDLKWVSQQQIVWLREQEQAALAQNILVSTPVELSVNQFYNRHKTVTYYIIFCYQFILINQQFNFRNKAGQKKKSWPGVSCHKKKTNVGTSVFQDKVFWMLY